MLGVLRSFKKMHELAHSACHTDIKSTDNARGRLMHATP
jgi:Zn-dependent peptidase ImmA (M78 family)